MVWYSRDLAQSNHFCLYCAAFVGPGSSLPSDKEHLVGRKFVPSGYLDGNSFNFIFRACRPCNACKADAERHVSTVTLLTTPERASDPVIDAIAVRKASSDFHPVERGKRVGETFVEDEVVLPAVWGTVKLGMVGPPPLAQEPACLLAIRQVQALFSLVTTEDPRVRDSTRVLPPQNAIVFGIYNRTDWGNPQLLELARRTKGWACRLKLVTARGYFKALLLRSSVDTDGWFWALEWNCSFRVAGAIGDPQKLPTWLVDDLPSLEWSPPGPFRFRREVLLPDEDEDLFDFN